MRELNATGRNAAQVKTSDGARAALAAPSEPSPKLRKGRPAKSLNPMPWCKHPAVSTFGKLCSDQLKAYKP